MNADVAIFIKKSLSMPIFLPISYCSDYLYKPSIRTEMGALSNTRYTQELPAYHNQQTLPPLQVRSAHTSILCVQYLAYHTILLFQFS